MRPFDRSSVRVCNRFVDESSKSFAARVVFDHGSAEHCRTLILCALSRLFKVFSTSRSFAGTMQMSSSDRQSCKSRPTKSIEFSSKNQTKIVKTRGLRPNLAKNASERAMGVLPDVPVAPPSGPAAPQERSTAAPLGLLVWRGPATSCSGSATASDGMTGTNRPEDCLKRNNTLSQLS